MLLKLGELLRVLFLLFLLFLLWLLVLLMLLLFLLLLFLLLLLVLLLCASEPSGAANGATWDHPLVVFLDVVVECGGAGVSAPAATAVDALLRNCPRNFPLQALFPALLLPFLAVRGVDIVVFALFVGVPENEVLGVFLAGLGGVGSAWGVDAAVLLLDVQVQGRPRLVGQPAAAAVHVLAGLRLLLRHTAA